MLSLLVSDGLDGLSGALIVVFLHVPVHGAQLHLTSEVNIHRALLHCGVDELIGRVPQLQAGTEAQGQQQSVIKSHQMLL